MKNTLLVTSIYSNLWGTEFGGRPSRKLHYKYSLYNILKMEPTKCVCFTSESEYEELCNFFYNERNVDKDVLDIRVFELKDSKYFDEIRNLKNIEEVKKGDRCYEIQYNKFFWLEEIKNIEDYDYIYWFDAGLSHHGLFPKEYREEGDGFETHFKVKLFKKELLQKFNRYCQDKLIILSKNNSNGFYWMRYLPDKYFDDSKKGRHIVGGMFGGKKEKMIEYKNIFDELLRDLLKNEKILYSEEQLMTSIYENNKSLFKPLEFDDWYHRPFHEEEDKIKYFCDMFL